MFRNLVVENNLAPEIKMDKSARSVTTLVSLGRSESDSF
jgi:hypothetical protein